MKKTVRYVRTTKGRERNYRERDLTDLRKLRAKLNLAACDLHRASPFLTAERDPDHMLAWREGDVRRRIAEEFAINVDFAAAGRGSAVARSQKKRKSSVVVQHGQKGVIRARTVRGLDNSTELIPRTLGPSSQIAGN